MEKSLHTSDEAIKKTKKKRREEELRWRGTCVK
jgi:hypothetical protein